jgi:hypothetical protein
MKRIIFTVLLFGLLCGNADAFLVGYSRGIAGPDVTDPELSTATANGTDRTLVFTEAVTADTTGELCSDWALTWTTAGADSSWTYASGDGTNTVHCAGADVGYGDTVSDGLDYTPGTIVDLAGTPNALAAITSAAVTNNTPEPYNLYWSADADGTIEHPAITATLYNGASIVAGGVSGNYVSTAAYNSYSWVPITTSEVDINGIWRIRVWMRQPAGAAESAIFNFRGQTGNAYALWNTSGNLTFYYGSDYASFYAAGGEFNLADDTWYHFEFYVNNTTGVQGIRCINRNCADSAEGTCESEESISTAPTGDPTSLRIAGGVATSTMNNDEIYIFPTDGN